MFRTLLATLALVTLLAGCGGGGGGSSALGGSYGAVSSNSPFQGAYAGYWWDGARQDDLTITVRPDGTFTGQVSDPFIATDATVTGNVRDDGSLAATYKFPDRDRVTLAGTVVRQSGGGLQGNFTARQGDERGQVQIVMQRAAS